MREKISMQFSGYAGSNGQDLTLDSVSYLVILGSGFYTGHTEIGVLVHAQGQFRATFINNQQEYLSISGVNVHIGTYCNYYFIRLG